MKKERRKWEKRKRKKADFVKPKPDAIYFTATRAVHIHVSYHIRKCFLGYVQDAFQSRRQERGRRTQAFLAAFIDQGWPPPIYVFYVVDNRSLCCSFRSNAVFHLALPSLAFCCVPRPCCDVLPPPQCLAVSLFFFTKKFTNRFSTILLARTDSPLNRQTGYPWVDVYDR